MNELGIDVNAARPWFAREDLSGYSLIRIPPEATAGWAAALGVPVRRCYVSDALLSDRITDPEISAADVIASALPDPGSVMSGDFGEILVLIYNCAAQAEQVPVNPKKWRLKQDPKQPAPYSDVLNFIVPGWPNPSAADIVICSEVKAKATNGSSSPISDAIEGCEKDRTSRLAKTLVWLKNRAIREDLGALTLAHINRFLNATAHPPYTKRFQAVAVICSSLLDQELGAAPTEAHQDYTVHVISVPELHRRYTEVFAAAASSGL